MSDISGIQRACDNLKGQQALAAALDVTQQAVSAWVLQGYVPWERAKRVAELSGVPAKDLVKPEIQELFE